MALRSEDEISCELKSIESSELSQRLIRGDVRTEVCKVVVGAFVLATVMGFTFPVDTFRFGVVRQIYASQELP